MCGTRGRYEDMKTNPKEVWAALQAFLELPPFEPADISTLHAKSSTKPYSQVTSREVRERDAVCEGAQRSASQREQDARGAV